MSVNHSEISSFIWKILDDVLRNVFKQHEYGDVIIPFVVLRRLDCLLEPHKDEVVELYNSLKDEIDDPNSLNIKTILNGKTMQDWNTADMIFDVPTLIEFLSGSTTLEPGTIILTGTPHGIGFARNPKVLLKKGDTVTIEIEKIGKLTNPVIDETL